MATLGAYANSLNLNILNNFEETKYLYSLQKHPTVLIEIRETVKLAKYPQLVSGFYWAYKLRKH
jgi:hypothetical protein